MMQISKKKQFSLLLLGVAAVEILFFTTLVLLVGSNLTADSPVTNTLINSNSSVYSNGPIAKSSTSKNTALPRQEPQATQNDSQIRTEISDRLNSWKSSAEGLDLNAVMSHYDDTIDYYRKQRASLEFVKKDKLRAFSRYSTIRIRLSNITIDVAPSGTEASVVLDKQWDFQGNGSSSGIVRQLIRFRRTNGQWLIAAEKELPR